MVEETKSWKGNRENQRSDFCKCGVSQETKQCDKMNKTSARVSGSENKSGRGTLVL